MFRWKCSGNVQRARVQVTDPKEIYTQGREGFFQFLQIADD